MGELRPGGALRLDAWEPVVRVHGRSVSGMWVPANHARLGQNSNAGRCYSGMVVVVEANGASPDDSVALGHVASHAAQ